MAIERASFTLNNQISATSATSREVLYTATNGVANISQATAVNTDTSARDLYIYMKEDSTTSGSLTHVEKITISAGKTVALSKLIAHNVPASGTIQAHASTTNVIYVTISGTTSTS